MAPTTLRIAHFNDVYRVQPFKLAPTSPETIDVTQFSSLLTSVRDAWPERAGVKDEDGKGAKDGLTLFSGDVFSPSVESSVTRGSHMVPVMNHLAPDVSLTGNHDFDFGYPHLTKLIGSTKFPWLLSNIVDNTTGKVPEHLLEYSVIERCGVRVGVIGLVEKEWIGTVSNWPANFEYRDMAEVGLDLSKRLRDPKGEHRVDLVIALTHARVPNDLTLAKSLSARSPRGQKSGAIVDKHGADLLLGGHDHLYFVSHGVDAWDNYDLSGKVLGAEDDDGSVLVVKSGTDFRDLSSLDLELSDTPEGSVRRKVISKITGIHHATSPDGRSDEMMKGLLKDVLDSVGKSLKAPVCKTSVELDVRSQFIRTAESAAGNWFADIIRHAYDGALCTKGVNTVDCVFICAGMLRGDSVYGPGDITLGDILEILPFEDPLVVIRVDGRTIRSALEAGLSTWPAQEGRFPVLAGLRVDWDSRKPKGERVLSIKIVKETDGEGEDEERDLEDDRKYALLTREYMALGHDGFEALKGHEYLVDDESGQMMSAIVRKYLLGSLYVHKMARQNSLALPTPLSEDTSRILHAERERQAKHKPFNAIRLWRLAASKALHASRQHAHYRDHIGVAEREHMSAVDCFDGEGVRGRTGERGDGKGQGEKRETSAEREGDLLTICPEVDGRLRDVGREVK